MPSSVTWLLLFLYPVLYIEICFFFQAEDGIRDYKVTGVQTCALPISSFLLLYRLVVFGVPALLFLVSARSFLAEQALLAASSLHLAWRGLPLAWRWFYLDRKSVV